MGEPTQEEIERAAAEWIAALREHESMSSETRDRLQRRIESSLEALDEDDVGERVVPLRSRSRARALPWIGAGVALAAAAALAFALGRGGYLLPYAGGPIERAEAPYGQVTGRDAPGRVEARAKSSSPRASSSALPEDDLEEVVEPRGVSSASSRSRPKSARDEPVKRALAEAPSPDAPPTRAPTLAEETEALRGVRRALAAGEPARALELLQAYERRFAAGVLVEERGALRVIALCEADLRAQGRAEARRFLERYPSSALATRVREACRAGHD